MAFSCGHAGPVVMLMEEETLEEETEVGYTVVSAAFL